MLYTSPLFPSGVNQASGPPSNSEGTSPPCRCGTAGGDPMNGLKQPGAFESMHIRISGSAQWMVWSTLMSPCTSPGP